ncbi:U2 snRNP component prp10 [Apiotrichum porosum]|uniref:U2 snRNP component prp10 n=1 Tax=Apiotrichum porosum TaxID=105984 RepID=A0A427Y566_9TREE|nr:U2 snRNP component prp10 [Apiotrichum porosum]RSH86229.1 U2 snRNP component prp10 [Apiotrichum porosum]
MSDEEDNYPQLATYTAPQDVLDDHAEMADEEDIPDEIQDRARVKQIAARQTGYQLRRFERRDGMGEGEDESYEDRMRRVNLEREEERVRQFKEQLAKDEAAKAESEGRVIVDDDKTPPRAAAIDDDKTPPRAAIGEGAGSPPARRRRWDETEVKKEEDTNGEEPAPKKRRSRWDQMPAEGEEEAKPRKSRWDQAPEAGSSAVATSSSSAASSSDEKPSMVADKRYRAITDDELNSLLPGTNDGYAVVPVPEDYHPQAAVRKMVPATSQHAEGGFMMQDEGAAARAVTAAGGFQGSGEQTEIEGIGTLQFLKAEDAQYFAKVLGEGGGEAEDVHYSMEELKERKIMRLLLKIKNGTPPVRKTALRQITDKAREFGAGPLFDKILPLLMERSLEDQERHLLVKVIDRVLYKLDDLVRPYVHKILVVIEPLLIDEDYYARVEGREIISNLAKAAGLAHMISTMRPDIDHVDEYVRNTTARAFAVVASALGIPALLPFLKAVCRSKKSWQARHTGIRIIQQIAVTMGCAVLPHLRNLVDAIADGLQDEQQKVRTMTALALAALAEAAAPYGIESFDNVLKPLWIGIRQHRGKTLAAFLRAIGYIIPLMDPEYAGYYVRECVPILIREFQTSDEEMRRIVLQVIKQCAGTEGVTPSFIRQEILPEFFKAFWVRRMALDRRNYRQLVETTVSLAAKAGVSEIVGRITNDLKDESEPYRKMVMETITKVVTANGAADIDERMEVLLIDGVIFAFQEQTMEDNVMLDGFSAVVAALGSRVKPYLPQIVSMILWRLTNKSAKVRMLAADLTTKLAPIIKQNDEDALLSKLGIVLFEQLGEEYPDALGSIIAAEASIANVVGMTQMNPPVKDLLPRMTPILRNRHEKVQEATINLIGRIADRGAEQVAAKEWMRICFELLDLLKAHKKAIRRAAVNSFGYIAKAIGPQDVLSVLLTNLKVQERQSRVLSTVAIAIVAETCGPFTCIPAILNEYRTPELNVRNGCLKALAYVFEYVGEMSKDYIHSVVGLLEDSLTDRDHVHRQTACAIVKHLTVGVAGLGYEEALTHLLNLVWPNIFETSPHVIGGVMDAIEAMRIGLGPGVVLSYVLQGLYHPARRVREVYWRMYNTLILGAVDALVPFYPALGSAADLANGQDYTRHHLLMFV